MSFHVERLECLRARRRVLSRACRGVTREAARYGSSVVEGCGRVVVVARIEGQMLELADTRHGEQTIVGLAHKRELGNETSCAIGAVKKKKTSSVPYLEETTP